MSRPILVTELDPHPPVGADAAIFPIERAAKLADKEARIGAEISA
jgi:hypothetical protein